MDPTPTRSDLDAAATRDPIAGDVQTLATDAPSVVPGYELGELIGQGGMGDVYRARDLELDREVAVKILQQRYPTESPAAARFLEEARITAQLQHPGIPAVYRVAKLADGRPFLAMKLIKGRTLDELLMQNTPVNHLAIIEPVAQALGYAHAHDVIHRDVKPQNVMVGAFGEVQVMDWGLAKVLTSGGVHPRRLDGDPEATTAATLIRTARGSDYTQLGSVLGTPAYMPPEQAAGETNRVGTASDVFGLGALWCRMLTGEPPFTGADAESVRRSALRGKTEEALARLEQCGAEPGAVALCKRCLAIEPEDRPRDANEVAAEVARLRVAAEERAKAAELSRARAEVQAAEQAKRRRVVQRAAVAVAAVLLVGVIGTGVGLWHATETRHAAEAAEQDAQAKRVAAEAAEAKEAEQRKKAEEETALANAVKEFLQRDVLQLADPATQQQEGAALKYDADVRLRDVVLRAAERIEGKFKDRPLVEAEIRETLGQTLRGMGRPDLAAKQAERVRQLCREQLGPDHPNTLRSMHSLAGSYYALDRHAEALKLVEETLTLMKAKLGPDHPDTLRSMVGLAITYAALGRHAEALKLREETLALMKAKLGPEHPDMLITMNNLAVSYEALDRHAEALKLREETLALMKAKLGSDHPATLRSTWGLAVALVKLDRGAEAVPVIDECLTRAAGKPVNPMLVPAVMDLRLRHFQKSGDPAGCRTTAEMWEKLNRTDADSLYTAACMRAVTAAVLRAGDSPEAVKPATGEADRAMAWLTKAVAAGFKDRARMEKDKDLDSLRDRDDFKKLLAGLLQK